MATADDRDMEFTYADVRAAREIVRRHLPPTPMWRYPLLDAVTGATVFVKHENCQPVGAFKVRGGLTLLAAGATDLVTYSTGNHAQSLAYASQVFGARCTVVMPAGAPAERADAVRQWGAGVVLKGDDLSGAQAYAEELAASTGARLVSPGDTPELLAGVGTLYQEIFEAEPDLDAVVVPIGSGTGAAAACVVAAALAPRCQVIGVQSSSSPAAHDSWRLGTLEARPNRTTVAGLATGRGFALPQCVMRARLADFLLVSDEEIGDARRVLARRAHTQAEGAGAAALAAVMKFPDRFAGRRVAVVCTGGNADPTELAGN